MYCLFDFGFGTELASNDVIGNVLIHSGPVDVSVGEVSHLFNASIVVV